MWTATSGTALRPGAWWSRARLRDGRTGYLGCAWGLVEDATPNVSLSNNAAKLRATTPGGGG
eukprot:6311128-Lingulodinium_polyedra.AAC.1